MTRPNYEERESFIYIFSSCQKWENMGRRNARINGGMGWGRELDLCTEEEGAGTMCFRSYCTYTYLPNRNGREGGRDHSPADKKISLMSKMYYFQ